MSASVGLVAVREGRLDGDGDDVGGGVEVEGHGEARGGLRVALREEPHAERDDDAEEGLPERARDVEGEAVERDGVGEAVAGDEVRDHGLPGGHVEGVGGARDERDGEDEGQRDVAGVDEHAEGEGAEHHDELRGLQDALLGEHVDEGAREEAQQQAGGELRDVHEAEGAAGVPREFQDEVGLGGGLHPGADEVQHLRGPEEPEGPDFEGPERAGAPRGEA